jgi:hypothetical protein
LDCSAIVEEEEDGEGKEEEKKKTVRKEEEEEMKKKKKKTLGLNVAIFRTIYIHLKNLPFKAYWSRDAPTV